MNEPANYSSFAVTALFLVCASLADISLAVEVQSPPAYGKWRQGLIGGGGYIQNVVLCPSAPNRAYAYVDNSGMFRSEDQGRSWRMIHGGLPTSFGIYAGGMIELSRNGSGASIPLRGRDKPAARTVSSRILINRGGSLWPWKGAVSSAVMTVAPRGNRSRTVIPAMSPRTKPDRTELPPELSTELS